MSADAGKLVYNYKTPPPMVMRSLQHSRAAKWLVFSLVASVGAGCTYFFAYANPRRKKYDKFFAEYDAYQRAKEICSYPIKFMHSCPSELAKMAEEKGFTIAPIGGTPKSAPPPEQLETAQSSSPAQ